WGGWSRSCRPLEQCLEAQTARGRVEPLLRQPGFGAKAFSPVRNLNQKPSEGFALAADDRGMVTASFLSGKLFTMISRDNGETFTASAELNPAYDPCDCCTTSAAYGPDGKVALLYREETN